MSFESLTSVKALRTLRDLLRIELDVWNCIQPLPSNFTLDIIIEVEDEDGDEAPLENVRYLVTCRHLAKTELRLLRRTSRIAAPLRLTLVFICGRIRELLHSRRARD